MIQKNPYPSPPVQLVRARVEADSGVDEDEVATCRHQDTQQVTSCLLLHCLVEAARLPSSNRATPLPLREPGPGWARLGGKGLQGRAAMAFTATLA